jgi:hypothetical protein
MMAIAAMAKNFFFISSPPKEITTCNQLIITIMKEKNDNLFICFELTEIDEENNIELTTGGSDK